MENLPQACEVLVVGAGPAGSACAQMLARAGLDVLLVDEQEFPREKVCGDGLIPDALAALRRLGVFEEVMAQARRVTHVACVGPRGGRVDVPGTLAVLPRRELDMILCTAARRAGARWLAPARFEAPLLDGERVVGARLQVGGQPLEVSARWVVLATGARPQALMAAGLCERHTPSGVALRAHVRHEALAQRLHALEVVWHPRLRGGYGWIFPGPDGVFNIGTGLLGSHRADAQGRGRMQPVNLRRLFEAFCEVYAPARELMASGQVVSEIKGAPLRCSLTGARWSRPGMLVCGEAAGSTYAFTGEGIGKAMETGMLAAQALQAERPESLAEAQLRGRYEETLRALQPRFAMYEQGNRINDHPWVADLVIWRARRSPSLLHRISGVLEERTNPGNLLSVRGLMKLLVPGYY
ncbi:NAD(P)/FAD-dependent oxidoreductase [Azohydromonas caseinilytica]|uniref:Geranylgeranyl reductase family protein n=1 Tax=Azohydromonas caseinilytica TaxID=2728836 RepID=A0A848FK66_9BURK|nr:geranylgeranyl reductase family protein [Azohydromonas caseinilytica]NML18640.1 geranylgeranyl reductase family protein [Azohydromonas caseinilytica]